MRVEIESNFESTALWQPHDFAKGKVLLDVYEAMVYMKQYQTLRIGATGNPDYNLRFLLNSAHDIYYNINNKIRFLIRN